MRTLTIVLIIIFSIYAQNIINRRRRAEAALNGTHAELDQIFSTAADGMRVIDKNYNILRINKKFLEIADISRDEALSMKCYEAFPCPLCHTASCPLTRIPGGGEERIECDVEKERRDGSRVPCILTATSFRNPDGEVIGIVENLKDITERKRTEKELAAAYQTMLDILEFLPDATFVIDSDGRVIAWNRAMEVMTGVKAEEMIGKGDHEYAVPFYGERRQVLIDLAFVGKDAHWLRDHYSHIRKDGDVLIADTTLPRPLGRKSVLTGTVSPLYNSNGRVMGAIESIRDITERKAGEQALEAANKKLQLLSGITRHDILNQVTALAGYTELLNNILPDNPKILEYIDRITKATSAIERQIRFTRDYQSLGMDPSQWQHVADAAERAASGCAHIVALNVSINTGALEVFADPMLEKAFYNLFDNAVRHGVHVTEISVSCQEEDEDGSVVIAVEDDGIGVPAELKEKIFRHGFGKHTGYGLFLVQEILGITGISIQETGTEGKGARFEITVPSGGWQMEKMEQGD